MVAALVVYTLLSVVGVLATPIIFDGRAPFNYTKADFDGSVDPYLTVVKGSENASHYTQLLGRSTAPTPLWNKRVFPLLPFPTVPSEQVLAVSIDNSSVFVPGGNPQFGFRRTDVIAEKDFSPSNLLPQMEAGVTVFHFSIKLDEKKPLNYNHEYQIVFIEPNDGSHVFGIQLGSPFTNPTGKLPAQNAHNFKVLDHALNVLFSIPFISVSWHNFAVQVDWDKNTLAVLYSKDADPLKAVTKVVPNLTHATSSAGQGDFHFGVLKLPLVNPEDSPANQGDVVHHGIQEGTTEGLLYSGVFVEGVQSGISLGGGRIGKALSN
ncbi:hypothetical protein GALMADRAFT_220528 [Galerina marginata CBS 339.88]|uniref:Glycoside hydrolase 131 catalytic N-terminal domain-containing protein n=1 Tax=Galerina marginata (strain CBS 339.88) TaxID=685588 RepID=A0A067TRL0_GALM3|nr:hypothetical protein GALMADRAFT_220528 [Galerina marginata CBS 339.88]